MATPGHLEYLWTSFSDGIVKQSHSQIMQGQYTRGLLHHEGTKGKTAKDTEKDSVFLAVFPFVPSW